MKESFSEKGGWWVVLQFTLMASILASGPFLGRDWSGPWSPIIGALLMLASAGVGIAGTWTLGKNRTAYPVPKKEAQLIQHGIYRHIRHPLYTSLILLGLGWALSWHSGAALIATATMTIQLRFKAKFEERHLEQLFPDYPTYRERVPPFFPRIR